MMRIDDRSKSMMDFRGILHFVRSFSQGNLEQDINTWAKIDVLMLSQIIHDYPVCGIWAKAIADLQPAS